MNALKDIFGPIFEAILNGEMNNHFSYGNNEHTTNAVESVNSSFRKVTKQGVFPNENALLKLLYLRITELYKKWENGGIQNWAMVRNQLSVNPK